MSQLSPDEAEKRYQRLFRLYSELQQELDSLEKEGHKIVAELRAAIDKKKMEQALKNIKGE